jgi:hypothetical protein
MIAVGHGTGAALMWLPILAEAPYSDLWANGCLFMRFLADSSIAGFVPEEGKDGFSITKLESRIILISESAFAEEVA